MAPPVIDQEFVVHLFAFEDRPQSDLAYQQLRRLWTACREHLGMSGPIAELDVADRLPDRKEDLPSGEVLAAQERVGFKDRQCVLRRVGEVLNLSVILTQPQPEGSSRGGLRRITRAQAKTKRLGWGEFSQLWTRVCAGGIDALFGGAIVLLARTPTKGTGPITPTARLGQSLPSLLPENETRPTNWWHSGVTSGNGFGVWDTHLPAATSVRELLVVAPADADVEMSAWVWSNGTATLPPLADYLLHSAVLRYQVRVLEGWLSAPRLADLDALIAEVAATFDRVNSTDLSEDEDCGRLLRAHLNRLKATELRLNTLQERLQQIANSAQAALRQMATAWNTGVSTTNAAEAIPDDLALAHWLIDQATSEHDRQNSRLNRTAAARTLVADELDRFSPGGDLPPTRGSRSARHMAAHTASMKADTERKVFVVHGRDEPLRELFFSFLQALDLRPQDWELLVSATEGTSPSLMDVVRRAPEIAQATVVLLSPDDVVQLHPDLRGPNDLDFETAQGCQARPNVLLELGMALMAFPERTIVIEVGELRPIADLAGLNVIRFDGSGPSIDKVIKRLRQAGCPVDDGDTSWRDPHRFSGLDTYHRTPGTNTERNNPR